jgi:hypothetical protein
MKILITQPTFLPWIGYFDLISDAEVIIFLDDVQFEKRSWQQRNYIATKDGLKLITIPTKNKNKRTQLIKDVIINNDHTNFNKIKKFIIQNYTNSKFFENFQKEFFEVFYENLKTTNLLKLNLSLIFWILKKLKINKKIYLSSKINSENKSTKKIIDICNELKIYDYLTTPGSRSYLERDIDIIKNNKINVFFHNYDHPIYRQCVKPFLKYSSVIDLLFNEGENSFEIIKSGSRPHIKLLP